MKKYLILITVLLFGLSCGVRENIQRKKVIVTMRDMSTIASGLYDYITDHGAVLKQNGTYNEESEFYKALAPYYLKTVPINDQWGENFIVYCGKECEGKYGISYAAEDDFLVCSFGRDKVMEYNWSYDRQDEEAGLFTVYSIHDFDKDLINYSGAWIRVPLYLMKK